MAGNTFEDRLTRLEEQLKALQALTRRLVTWETGGTGTLEPDEAAAEPGAAQGPAVAGFEGGTSRDEPT